jgi:hypothetical protein
VEKRAGSMPFLRGSTPARIRQLLNLGGMIVNDSPGRKRTNEEEYFQKRDRELIEQMRQRAKAQQELRELGEQVGVTDPELSRELAEMGFTPETVKLLPLIPVLEMAWAEGEVTAAERKMVVDAARVRGIEAGGMADRQLADWLDRRPDDSVFRRAGSLINALVESGGRFDITPDDIIKYCEAIADASGGLFGIRRVSAEERETLSRIANEIQSRQK